MILLWGIPSDPPIATIEAELARIGAPTLFLDQRASPDTTVTLEVGPDITGSLTVFDQTVALERITAVYCRPHGLAQLGLASPKAAAEAAALHQAMSIWLDLTPAKVVTRPAKMALNGSKPYQAALIEGAGFRIPETLLTTDPDAVGRFRARHGEIVYKSISAIRSIVTRLKPADETRLQDVTWCPTQFQRWIGGFEVRVHVVGRELFACRIVTDADDYRYASRDGLPVDLAPFELPAPIARRCLDLADVLGYELAGIDLRCEGNEWYCLEANPSPSFSYYERATGNHTAAALARLLADTLT